MVPLVRRYSGLVYIASVMVGSSMPSLFCSHRRTGTGCMWVRLAIGDLMRLIYSFKMDDGKNWVVGRTREQAKERAEILANGVPFTLEQDEDVLDTWFSSGLWPFSIMGWPDKVRWFFGSQSFKMLS